MFRKGRKLVDLVHQNDKNKTESHWLGEKPESKKTSSCDSSVDRSTNTTLDACTDGYKTQKNSEVGILRELPIQTSPTSNKDNISATHDINTSIENIENNNGSEPLAVRSSTNIYDNTENIQIIKPPNENEQKIDSLQSPTLLRINTLENNILEDTVSASAIFDPNLINENSSPSLLGKTMLEQQTDSIEIREISPTPGTSTGISEDNRNILYRDLYLSDSSTNVDVVSPYIDSESSYCPTPPKKSRPSFSTNSDTEEGTKENTFKRRQKAKPETWKRNVLKRKRQTGKAYISRSGKPMEEKKCKPTDCSKCRYKCNSLFPDFLRQDIFDEYWNLGDSKQQKIMISSLITHAEVTRIYTKAKKNRTMARQYWLFHQLIGRKRVCQKFFCNTFNISSSIINNCSKNIGFNGLYVGNDQRKGKVPHNITSQEETDFVREHIDQYPRIESHYCRKNSRKLYLDSDLNLSRLYQMYKQIFCPSKNITPVSSYVYQRIFHSYNPRLAFYKPKKDQCTKCNVFKRSDNKAPLQEEHDAHKKREQDSFTIKKEDKQRCLNSSGAFRAITFDLQAILSIPFTGDCKIFYLRKLSLYNFTIMDCHENTGYCYLWDECNGKKGSTEIGSILIKYLYSLPENVTHVASFSDTAGGQNRNKYVTLAALYAVNNIAHLETVDLKFMESGHSYLEVDSIHATIERARKHKDIFTLREYALVIGSARIKPKPYNVVVMKYGDFYDLKALDKTLNPNTTKNTKNEVVQWLKIKWLRVQKQSPTSIFYKYDLTDPDFKEIDICKYKQKKTKDQCIDKLKMPLKEVYKSHIAISQTKKKDLLTLLKDGVIPADYDTYYKDIPCTSEQINNNVSDVDESSDDGEEFNISET